MLNVEIGKLRDSEVLEVVREFVSYYNEGDYDMMKEIGRDDCPNPCIETFCYYSDSLVKENAKKLKSIIGMHKDVCVDYEHFGGNFSRIMVYLEQTTPLYELVAHAKTLSQFGFRKYMELECLALDEEAKERESKVRIAEYNELKRVAKETAKYCKDLESKGIEIGVVQVVTFDCDSVYWTDVKVVYNDGDFEYFTSSIQRSTFEESVKDGKKLIELLVKHGLSMDKHILDDTEIEKF